MTTEDFVDRLAFPGAFVDIVAASHCCLLQHGYLISALVQGAHVQHAAGLECWSESASSGGVRLVVLRAKLTQHVLHDIVDGASAGPSLEVRLLSCRCWLVATADAALATHGGGCFCASSACSAARILTADYFSSAACRSMTCVLA